MVVNVFQMDQGSFVIVRQHLLEIVVKLQVQDFQLKP